VEETLYGFTDSYYLTEIFIPGSGYWLRFDNSDSTTVSGNNINEITISLSEGWNLIAGPSGEVPVSWVYDPDSLIVPNTLFGYDASGYIESNSLAPGYGYWIRSFGSGEISLSIGWNENVSHFQYLEKKQEDLNNISINGKTLYFGNSILSKTEKLSFSLPPKPPVEGTDIRFSGDTKLCTIEECVIEVMSSGQDLFLSYNIIPFEGSKSSQGTPVWMLVHEKTGEEFTLTETGVIEITGNVTELILRKSISPQTPTEFTLFPAHPNPFNPSSTIRFAIPDVKTVYATSLHIYDIQGRLVETLVNEKLSSGNHSVQWNAKKFASGVYFIHLQSGNFSKVDKLMLIK
jgi:hypothetical protein